MLIYFFPVIDDLNVQPGEVSSLENLCNVAPSVNSDHDETIGYFENMEPVQKGILNIHSEKHVKNVFH